MISSRGKVEFDRRRALALLSSAVAATLTRCQQPEDEIVPYVNMPERLVPGEALRFATALPLAGYGRGVLAIGVDGRPIKIEGNPRHPYSLGASDVFAESSILSLYDPERSQAPLAGDASASWQEVIGAWTRHAAAPALRNGAGMVLVTGRIASPTLLRLLEALKLRFPELRHYRYEPVHDDSARAGSRLAFGRVLQALPRLAEADMVVALDADPLGPGPSQLAHARGFAKGRDSARTQRLYVAQSRWTATGAMADHRLAMAPARIGEIARGTAAELGLDLGTPDLSENERKFAVGIAAELMQAQGRGLLLAGETQPPEIHALCHWMNARIGAPVNFVAPADPAEEDHGAAFSSFLSDLNAGRIGTLLVMDANPVYDAGADIVQALRAIPFSLHCGLYRDETAEHCRFHLPLSHPLEDWGDLKSPDGTPALVQPLIRPLYDTRTAQEFLALLAGMPRMPARDMVRATWTASADGDFDTWWRRTLHAGFVEGSAAAPIAVSPRTPPLPPMVKQAPGLVLTLSPHPTLWDGRYGANAWLQECPQPFTAEVWGNAVHVAPEDAETLGLADGDGITLGAGSRKVDAAVAILRGQPKGVLSATLGQGRWRAGTMGSNLGARVAALRGPKLETVLYGVVAHADGRRDLVRTTQTHTRLEGRDEELFPLAAASKIVEKIAKDETGRRGILPVAPPGDYAWAMVIDNDLCIGCNACVLACQAENNVAVVGPDEIARGRDMHWLRIDAYELASATGARRGFEPVPCMHCETAPCEPVCPVGASVHDHEGLNVQVYNRCIGTRFCEANCPYKVRRFNYFGYARGQEYGNLGQSPAGARHNPNVSVRGRGVMEKCTYCVQRISAARRTAEKENRAIVDGEVVTACQSACPTQAIHFGNRNDPDSQVAKLKDDPRHFALLGHLDTRPRTTYLAKIYRPNPALEDSEG